MLYYDKSKIDDTKTDFIWFALKKRCELNMRCNKEREIILQTVKRKCFENHARKTKLPAHLKEIFFYAAGKGDLESVQKVFYNVFIKDLQCYSKNILIKNLYSKIVSNFVIFLVEVLLY